MAGKFYPSAKGSRAMPKQTLTVEVNCDTLLEPVAKADCSAKRGQYYLGANGKLVHVAVGSVCSYYPRLIVTPKEPEVNEPKYTIPVEVTKEVWEKYGGGKWAEPKKGEAFMTRGAGVNPCAGVNHSQFDFGSTLVLTPRVQPYEFPPELRVPGVHSIVANRSPFGAWNWYVCLTEPSKDHREWSATGFVGWNNAQKLRPTLGDPPTPEQCNNDWKQSLFLNPDWKGE